MKAKRVHLLSAVNAANVSKSGGTYTVKDVCGAVDDIVMNAMLYGADQLAAGAPTLNGKPAPAGHPKNSAGQFISALSGDALLSSYAGAICRNARHEGGRTLVDLVVNEAQARAHPDGVKLVERLDAAINGANSEPIHVSTGLLCKSIVANGESRGKKYNRIATEINYDHVAFLLHEQGAGTPADGVGMFLNSAGEQEEIETVTVNTDPEDRREAGFLRRLVRRLSGNSADDLSFDTITSKLYESLPKDAWIREVFSSSVVYVAADERMYRQDYAIDSQGSLALLGNPVEVIRKVDYEPVSNSEKVDPVKDKILAALNASGISVEGKDDVQLLEAYNALITKPVADKLTAANTQLATIEANAKASQDAELTALATNMAGGSLTVDDLKALGLPRLKEIQANTKGAAPVLPSGAGDKPAADWYDINSLEG